MKHPDWAAWLLLACLVIQCVLFGLKLGHVVDWSWWLVCIPGYVAVAPVVFILGIVWLVSLKIL